MKRYKLRRNIDVEKLLAHVLGLGASSLHHGKLKSERSFKISVPGSMNVGDISKGS